MKWIVIIIVIALGMLVLAFMTPDEATGDLLSMKSIAQAFSGGSLVDHLTSLTPGRVITVTGNTAAHFAGKALGGGAGTIGSITNLARKPAENTRSGASELASSFVPQSTEEKQAEIIEKLEARLTELESERATFTPETVAEFETLIKELKDVEENGGLLQTLIDKTKTLTTGQEECLCSAENP